MNNREKFVSLLSAFDKEIVTRQEIVKLCEDNDLPVPQWFTNDPKYRVGRGMYKNEFCQKETAVAMNAQVLQMPKIKSVTTSVESESTIPEQYKNYVPFGNYDDLMQIVSSGKFYPVFITGHSGNGKTMMVEQICAKTKRKFVCVSITDDTDEGDLLGNYVLIDGQMVWRDGPVTVAARTGAVLCLDEIDYGAKNLSCLQRVLEGKPFLLKKKNEIVVPGSGFTIVATANTKGKGSDDGRYMFTNILNEAFLERFPVTMEQEWAPIAVEKRILKKELQTENCEDDSFANNLVTWADAIRKTFADDGCDEVISTRRLVQIVKAYSIFKDQIKAITYCLNRFDADTKASFIDLYTKVNAGVEVANTVQQQAEMNPTGNEQAIA
jgi:MoxR-like ATPase